MPKFLLLALLVLFAAGTVGLAFLSFARKVESFTTAGFAYEREGGSLRVTRVEPGGAAARAGLRPGDKLILADGRTASSLARPEKELSRAPFPHHLVILSAEEVKAVELGKSASRLDATYLFLAFIGFLYLLIGLFTLARERSTPARVFWALCLSSFAVYVMTPAGPRDTLWKATWLAEDFFRALLPALLLHFFLVFPRSAARGRLLSLIYLPAVLFLSAQASLLAMEGPEAARRIEWSTRFWFFYFASYAAAVLLRLRHLLRRRDEVEEEKQVQWIGLGVAAGLVPFLLLAAIPRALGLPSPILSSLAVVPLVMVPLTFAYAILKWRLWDVEIFVRESIATTAAVLLAAMAFVLVNALLDRTLEAMTGAGKNVIAFVSGLILASLLVPVKKRLTEVLEKIQYHDTYRARRALLDIARDFSRPRPREELAQAVVRRVEEALRVVPCSLFLFDSEGTAGAEKELLGKCLATRDLWHLRGSAFAVSEPYAATRLHGCGYRAFFAMRCGGNLVGTLGVGHKDGRIPLSSEDEALLAAVMAQAGLAYENARLYGALADRLEEIRTLQKYQESVIRSSSSGIVVLDAEGRIHSANPAFAQLVGRSEEKLPGLAFREVLPGVEVAGEAEASGERTFEAKFKNPDGSRRDLRISISAFHGAPDRRVVLVDDVTERLEIERALAERERLASLGVLAAGVAHEVNTPIAGLSSYAQLLLSETSPGDPRYPILKKMERQTYRAAHLVNNLLEFVRPGTRAKVRTDLRSVLANASESVETAFGSRNISLALDGDGDPLWVIGNPRELEQVFVNLLTNARDASAEGGVVSCSFRRDEQRAIVSIADRGHGLSQEVGEKVFQPFFTTKRSGGTGLGLAISREIIRRHGGEIALLTREGGGAVARVTLPLAASESS